MYPSNLGRDSYAKEKRGSSGFQKRQSTIVDPSNGGKLSHIPSLDGVRALSFLLVFLHHSILSGYVPGGLGVTTFFVLSGFLITTLMRLEAEQTGSVSLKNFYFRRTLRIVPPLMLSVVMGILISSIFEGRILNFMPIISNIFYFTNYYMIYGGHNSYDGASVLWSLAVEEHFYLVFPLIYIYILKPLNRPTLQAAVMGAICVVVLIWRVILAQGGLEDPHNIQRISLATDTRIDSIISGCILAVVANPALDNYSLSRSAYGLLTFSATVLILTGSLMPGVALRETIRYSLQNVGLMMMLVVVVRCPAAAPWRLLSHPWIVHLGVLSYSLYLFHNIILYAVRSAAPNLAEIWVDILGFGFSLLVAQAVLVVVERPCASLRRRFNRVNANLIPDHR